jgi:cyclic beta-1,2-glucan synthetase
MNQLTASRGGTTAVDPAAPGRDLAQSHAGGELVRPRDGIRGALRGIRRRLRSVADGLERLASDGPATRDRQWILDNGHVLEVALAQVRSDLPPAFHRCLPAFRGARRPRVAELAALAVDAGMDPAALPTRIVALLAGYQESMPLSMAELWALPSFVRLALLEAVTTLGEAALARRAAGNGESPTPERRDAAHYILALRNLAAIDWRELFEGASAVEQHLRADPAGVYSRMDFASRDGYRKVVERLARRDPTREGAISRTAVRLAQAGAVGARERHVGYYLVDRGLERLEREVGFRPRGARERARRLALARPRLAFFGGVSLALVGLLALLGGAGLAAGLGAWAAVGLLLASLPLALTVAETALRGTLGALVPPRALPKLDLSAGLPRRERTLVVLPVLLASREEVDRLLRRLEVNALANPDAELGFALLTDWLDAETPKAVGDDELLARAVAGIERLNAGSRAGEARFHLLHRERRFNAAESCWMGWERKRGKLEELNRLLLGESDAFSTRVGEAGFLDGVRFVITLDADTQLPRGAARRLVGALAHPLNAAELGAEGLVTRGYGVLQPRAEVAPESAQRSLFARLMAGTLGPDLYHSAVSDLHQDLFGVGLYAGKGIYDVRAFAESLRDRVPENRVLSHDLFEGLHARAGYVSDISVYEEVPSHVLGELARSHRWARGDWQLAPWLGRRVPVRSGRAPSRFRAIDRWKVGDNLRRTLLAPAALALLVVGIVVFPGDAHLWAAVALGPLLAPTMLDGLRLLARVFAVRRGWTFAAVESARTAMRGAVRAVLEAMLLPVRALVMLDATGRTLYRLLVSQRHLLEWRTAAGTARRFGATPSLRAYWARLWAAPLAAAVFAWLAASLAGSARALTASFALLWLVAPVASWRIGLPRDREQRGRDAVSEAERLRLRRLARRTWNFFEVYVRPENHWLPPDNFQEAPHGMVARRTSPSNIGLYLTSILAAYDLGYLDARRVAARLRNTVDTLARLERYRGHFWNWSSTETLTPLEPRYVSTVDSGNLAAALIVVARGCFEIAAAPTVRGERAAGIADAVAVLRETLEPLRAPSHPALRRDVLRTLRGLESSLRQTPVDEQVWIARLAAVRDETLPRLEGELGRWIEEELGATAAGGELAEIAAWLERVQHEIVSEIEDLTTFARLGSEGQAVADELRELGRRAEALALEMDFTFLFDDRRKLFRIGYDARRGELDPNHYDLLASEARLTSLWAIAKGDVPVEHWLHLGRPYGRVAGERALLSWGGTAFEYLLPELFLRTPAETPLARSSAAATRRQIAFARRRGVPWGISESAYHSYGAHDWYQYRAFGVPGTGLRRGLGARLVVAPYASLLALRVAPRAVIRNLDRLSAAGAAARFGFYEALDFGAARPRVRHRPEVVRSFMSHHQGMILAAIANFLLGAPLVRRFHADPHVATAAILLHEEVRFAPLADVRLGVERLPEVAVVELSSWRALESDVRTDLQVLSNGRLSVVVTATGGGGSRWRGMALTPWNSDPTIERHGCWIYLRDLDSGAVWSAGRAPTAVRPDFYEVDFAPHRVEIRRRDHGIRLHTSIGVAPAADLEVRRLTVTNESDTRRRLAITAFAEMAMASAEEAGRHPGFARLFVESEFVDERNALVFRRRPRWTEEPRLFVACALVPGPIARWESSRETFLGRGGELARPRWLVSEDAAAGGTAGATLDPAAVLETWLDLAAGERRELALVTAVGDSRDTVLAALDRASEVPAVEVLLADGRRHAEDKMRELELAAEDLRDAQRLLAAVLVPHPALRAPGPWQPGLQWPGQRGLWGHGISGDLPILLAGLGAEPNRRLVRSLLAIHAHWRRCCAEVDLVLLDEASEGYVWPLRDWLDGELVRTGAIDWLHRPGGVFVLRAKHLPAADRELLRHAARVLVDGAAASLDAVLAPLAVPPERLPSFVAMPGSPPGEEPTPPLAFDNGFGGFTADGREYVIHLEPGEPTPAPWINVVANPEFGFLVSESGAAAPGRQQRREPPDALAQRPGRRPPRRGALPARRGDRRGLVADARCRRAAEARTRCATVRVHALRATEPRLVQSCAVRAAGRAGQDPAPAAREPLAAPRRHHRDCYAEWVLGGRRGHCAAHVVCDLRAGSRTLLWRAIRFIPERRGVAFLAADRPPHGLTTDRRGVPRRRRSRAPPALARIGLPAASRPGSTRARRSRSTSICRRARRHRGRFLLGQAGPRGGARAWLGAYRGKAAVDRRAAADVAARALGPRARHAQVETPARRARPRRQPLAALSEPRLSALGPDRLYQSSGAFGFRDQLQDVHGADHAAPDWRASTCCAPRTSSRGRRAALVAPAPWPRRAHAHLDDLLWLPFATADYVTATGDAPCSTSACRSLPVRSSRRASSNATTSTRRRPRAVRSTSTAGARSRTERPRGSTACR